MDQYLIDFLKELKQFGYSNDIPNVSERGGRFLNLLVKITKAKKILEVGSANGYSTTWLADAASKNKGRVTTFDFSRPSFDAAKDNLAEVGLAGSVDFHFGDFKKVFPKLAHPAKFDFVFVDGQKSDYWNFWELIVDRLEEGALVVFDDVLNFPEKTDSFMRKIVQVSEFEHLVLPVDHTDGVLILYKL